MQMDAQQALSSWQDRNERGNYNNNKDQITKNRIPIIELNRKNNQISYVKL